MRILCSALIVLCVLSSIAPVFAQTDLFGPSAQREVLAEGRAAIGLDGPVAARRAAIALALRAAVEKVTGVYISARTLTQNFVLVRDQISTRAEGIATLKEVVRETNLPGEVRVVVRADVAIAPLTEKLRALNLNRAWRVAVQSDQKGFATLFAPLEESLTAEGFHVVSDPKTADIVVRASAKSETLEETPLDTAAGPMTMHSRRADVVLRAVRGGSAISGEVLTALRDSGNAAHIARGTADSEAISDALIRLSPKLVDQLSRIPAQSVQRVTVRVRGVPTMAQVTRIEDGLATLPGVQDVRRVGWDHETAMFTVDTASEALTLLARSIETQPRLRGLNLAVTQETRARIEVQMKNPGSQKAPRRSVATSR